MELFSRQVHNWADYASVLGVVISIVGFAGTIVSLIRSRSASQRVAVAVGEVRQKLEAQAAVADLTRALHDVDELRELHRSGAWEVLPSRYAHLRRAVLAIKLGHTTLTRPQKAALQGIMQQFTTIEEIVERSLDRKRPPDDIPELNRVAAEQGDKLSAILVAVQQTIGA